MSELKCFILYYIFWLSCAILGGYFLGSLFPEESLEAFIGTMIGVIVFGLLGALLFISILIEIDKIS
ncbi:MAG: hypothetical protein KAX49_03720 [Halanaerobiales bacterium]|nr:hypothetical protein [Halanaerobiales bacterium]